MNLKDHLILYVDDERPNRIVFEQSMNARFRIRTAGTASEALELFKTETVAVLVTDQRMPEMTGHELLVRVKALYPDTVRVVVTAYSDLDPILSAVNEGLVARYVIKPWDRAELDDLLVWALQAYEVSRQSSSLQFRLMQTERLVTLGSIAAHVLHDFNQPLSSVELYMSRFTQLAPLLQRAAQRGSDLSDISSEERRELLAFAEDLPGTVSDMHTSVKILRDLANSLQQFTRPDRAAAATPMAPLPVIRYAMSVCSDIAARARCRILYEGPNELPLVTTGSTELSQILINLIANAAQALLAKDKSHGRVMVRVVELPNQLRFVITDDGIGMTPELLAKVGNPFFSTRSEGTGLGVSICKRLVKRYGGELQIESTAGEGTTVQFTVPRA